VRLAVEILNEYLGSAALKTSIPLLMETPARPGEGLPASLASKSLA
jgi:hypothetical protein